MSVPLWIDRTVTARTVGSGRTGGTNALRALGRKWALVVVGDVDVAQVQAAVAEHFGSAPRARLATVLVPAEPFQLAPRTEHRQEDVEVTRGAHTVRVAFDFGPSAMIRPSLSRMTRSISGEKPPTSVAWASSTCCFR